MPKQTVVCYLLSLLFYGMGSSRISVLNSNAFTTDVLLATVYFVLTIWLIVIGSAYYYLMTRRKKARRLRSRRKVQVLQFEYDVDLLRRMTS
ncbi:hypothetical protein Desaci_1333 [Desulfosporosinus acidiphilus SJ4]|uniref:Uncharacterized protein n=1 Tax=Desulfosporosinus acidiphilus (strain DSM 22704 / JCM 16185 / SJ4) TaxID=646529 RepID=I4D3I5_DESAJ|nr:hypothetical protein [Desulfosporosinus acidiphilus]AFM40359.1 hypothetical protein Desaci_1333 [Desulfosporosinus acidiphilus SJ4]